MEDKVLKSLISGILLCGILFQAVFVWFSDAKVFFSLGLWIGVWHPYGSRAGCIFYYCLF